MSRSKTIVFYSSSIHLYHSLHPSILRLSAIKVLNTHQRAKRINTPEDSEESAHDRFSFRVVGEYPEVHHRQVTYLPPRMLYVLESSDTLKC